MIGPPIFLLVALFLIARYTTNLDIFNAEVIYLRKVEEIMFEHMKHDSSKKQLLDKLSDSLSRAKAHLRDWANGGVLRQIIQAPPRTDPAFVRTLEPGRLVSFVVHHSPSKE